MPRDDAPVRVRAGMRHGARRAPSLARELLQALLLSPGLAREVDIPHPDDGSPEGAALAAVVEFCASATAPPSTPAIVQHFADSPHDAVIAVVMTSTEDHALTDEHAAAQLRDGVARWVAQRDKREVSKLLATPLERMTAEERDAVRQRLAAPKNPPPGTTP